VGIPFTVREFKPMLKLLVQLLKRYIPLGIVFFPFWIALAQDDVTTTAPGNESKKSLVQDAVLEGIQLSSEKGTSADEKVVTCYFIFREQPSSYFYDTKVKDKKIVFEFNDTQLGITPIASTQEIPIEGFRIEETKVNTNEAVQGLTPEWHDVLRVFFSLSDIPQISVKDEYSIISFSFKWSSDPAKVTQYVVKKKDHKVLLFTTIGVGLAAGAGAAWYFLQPPPAVDTTAKPIPIDDLPSHPSP
jgi:hypothetical protein